MNLSTKAALKTYGSISISNVEESSDRHPRYPSRSSGGGAISDKPLVSAFCLFVAFGAFLFFGHARNNNGINNDDDVPMGRSNSRLGSIMMMMSMSSPANDKVVTYGDTPRFYTKQFVDHYDDNDPRLWTQRYYAEKMYWKGPGHPIFLTVGGEGGLDKGMFNPFVDRVMAKALGAYVLHPEHRFYGISQPVPNATNEQLLKLLTVEQAMTDMINIANHYRYEILGCSPNRSSPHYCPLIAVGGSYPAFLAMLMRINGDVDIAYASSGPVKLYEGNSKHADAYYEALTIAADRASPGCSDAVRSNLENAIEMMRNAPGDLETWAAQRLNICENSIPNYILKNKNPQGMLAQELIQLIAMSFADANMIGNYPPSNATRWAVQLCQVFQNATSPTDSVVDFWKHLEIQDNSKECFNMKVQLSEGRHATLSGADWSGLGPGLDGTMWDFQCCTDLLPAMSFSEKSMFPNRQWTYEWVSEHCHNRFGTVGKLGALKDKYGFDDLVGIGATRIIFTNGGNDMWLPGSYTHNLSDSLIAVNMPNGAHHSELYAVPPRVNATEDVQQAQNEIAAILTGWLNEIMGRN